MNTVNLVMGILHAAVQTQTGTPALPADV